MRIEDGQRRPATPEAAKWRVAVTGFTHSTATTCIISLAGGVVGAERAGADDACGPRVGASGSDGGPARRPPSSSAGLSSSSSSSSSCPRRRRPRPRTRAAHAPGWLLIDLFQAASKPRQHERREEERGSCPLACAATSQDQGAER